MGRKEEDEGQEGIAIPVLECDETGCNNPVIELLKKLLKLIKGKK